MRAVHVLVSGRVQGVGFRAFTVEAADRIGVVGWVRNLSDGRVEAWLEGEAPAVEAILEVLRVGPPAGEVRELSVSERVPEHHEAFRFMASTTSP
ncbi:MAG: acylphosphatase [Myxococcota bacterium]